MGALRRVMEAPCDPEQSLLERAASGEEAAVRELYRSHVERVHRTVARILGASDPDVDDVVQQVFMAALSGASSFGGRSKLSTWILGIATRRALDAARARARRGRWQWLGVTMGLGQPAARPDETFAAKNDAEASLAVLTPEQRVVFVLHMVEGHTFQEIAEMTGVGISTLHARLKAARGRLDALTGTAVEMRAGSHE